MIQLHVPVQVLHSSLKCWQWHVHLFPNHSKTKFLILSLIRINMKRANRRATG